MQIEPGSILSFTIDPAVTPLEAGGVVKIGKSLIKITRQDAMRGSRLMSVKGIVISRPIIVPDLPTMAVGRYSPKDDTE
jgi:hypothetical protein